LCTGILIFVLAMTLPDTDLFIAPSTLPGAGKGLFTHVYIRKGTIITEYKGRMQTWEEVRHQVDNDYIYYIDRQHVINAEPTTDALGRYANDGEGTIKVNGVSNNARYFKIGTSVYLRATVDIAAGSEILVKYGKGYWNQDKVNREQ
jgi:uncharacterized protein